jgi:hypothetical protein
MELEREVERGRHRLPSSSCIESAQPRCISGRTLLTRASETALRTYGPPKGDMSNENIPMWYDNFPERPGTALTRVKAAATMTTLFLQGIAVAQL